MPWSRSVPDSMDVVCRVATANLSVSTYFLMYFMDRTSVETGQGEISSSLILLSPRNFAIEDRKWER